MERSYADTLLDETSASASTHGTSFEGIILAFSMLCCRYLLARHTERQFTKRAGGGSDRTDRLASKAMD